MTGPITWRTIIGAQPAAAAAPLLAANQSFNQAFDVLGRLVSQEQARDQQNWQAKKDFNTQEAVQALRSQFQTPEQWQAAQQSGALDALFAKYGAQVDRSRLNELIDTRPAQLMERTRQANQYADDQLSRAYRGQIDAAVIAARNGDTRLLDALPADLPNRAQIVEQGMKAWQDETKFQQGNLSFQDSLATSAANRDHMKVQEANARAQLGVQQGQLQLARDNAKLNNNFRVATELDKAIERAAALDNKTLGSDAGRAAVMAGIAQVQDKRQRALLTEKIGPILADPANRNLSAADVLAVAQGSIDNSSWWDWSNNTGDTLADSVAKLRKQGATPAANPLRDAALEQVDRFRGMLVGVPAPSDGRITPSQQVPMPVVPAASSQQVGAANPATPASALPPAPLQVPGLNVFKSATGPLPNDPNARFLAAQQAVAVREATQQQLQARAAAGSTPEQQAAREFLRTAVPPELYRQRLASWVSPAQADRMTARYERELESARKKAK